MPQQQSSPDAHDAAPIWRSGQWDQLGVWAVMPGTNLNGYGGALDRGVVRFVVVDGRESTPTTHRTAVIAHSGAPARGESPGSSAWSSSSRPFGTTTPVGRPIQSPFGDPGPIVAGMVEKIRPGHFPKSPIEAGHVEPAPRRVRGMVGDQWLFDTTRAFYVWEHPYYPQYHVPAADVRAELLVDDDQQTSDDRGAFAQKTIRAGAEERPAGARLLVESADDALADTYRFEWDAIDRWFEEDEEIFVHPRSPYVRVDALRSSAPIRLELDGTTLAESAGSVMVFETSLPPRYYLEKTAIDWSLLEATDTETECPYKGTTSGYWNVRVGESVLEDVAWGYDFPTRQLQPVTGLVGFYDEKLDVYLNGERTRRG